MTTEIYFLMQVGIPSGREQYIHRLGRTGRKGREGQGLLLLAPWEKYFLGTVKDLSIAEADLPSVDSSVVTEVSSKLRTGNLTLLCDYFNSCPNLVIHFFFFFAAQEIATQIFDCKYN